MCYILGMAQSVHILLMQKPSVHAPVKVATPAPESQQVMAVVAKEAHHLGWCLLMDSPLNVGCSVTNGCEDYAQAVCETLACNLEDLAWFELDSTGHFDALSLLGSQPDFIPLQADNGFARNLPAFMSQVARLPGGLPPAAVQAIELRLALFGEKQNPRSQGTEGF